jgi:Uncharacterised nucleotidyltransferase
MSEAYTKSRGWLVAAMLAGSWRPSPTIFERAASELEEIASLLLKSGAAALFWRRLRSSNLRAAPVAAEFHQVYRQNILREAVQQQTIAQAIELLREAEIEPVLVKGRAVSRLYPEEGLRPCGDIDLCVRPEQLGAAGDSLKKLLKRREVDLHCGFEKFGGGSVEEIYARSQLISLGEITVRVPCAEDHLRVLCIHLLREGAWRPLWLCDVAVAVESRPANFDWDCCLGRNRRWSNWVICVLRLAHELLGADLSGTPAARNQKPLPRWLIPAILKEWNSLQPSMVQRHHAPMASYKHIPASFLKGLRHRWPNPIEATVSVGGRFNEWPRLPFQLGSYLARGAKFAARLPRTLREY